jgi:hypothetical protein
MPQSARLGAPLIQPAQVDKATTHNEALALLDVAISAAIDGLLVDTPPASPAIGNCYVIGANPTGAWTGHARALAGYTEGGWRFIAAIEGLTALDKASGETAIFRAGAWEKGQARVAKLSIGGNQVVGARGAAVVDPAGGTIIDAEARAAIVAVLARLRAHGLIAS